ncbi:MAG TPA: hypothetical protein VK936_00585 [Longimicrobiales bacterium]|nr:hypothetical protein [Longimicrobiales bacterium]
MPDERRYQEDEIAEIFEAATSPRPATRKALSARGLTLAELQEIGGEVGLEPDQVARAASALDARRGVAPRHTQLGMPVGVGRTLELPRAPTDAEWNRLVAELRSTFRASGRESSRGDVREWRNGNLHAYIEPAESGYRLRLGTTKSDAGAVTGLGIGGLGMAAAVSLVVAATGNMPADLIKPVILGLAGSGTLAFNALRLPRWASERERQMEYIAERAREIIKP